MAPIENTKIIKFTRKLSLLSEKKLEKRLSLVMLLCFKLSGPNKVTIKLAPEFEINPIKKRKARKVRIWNFEDSILENLPKRLKVSTESVSLP